MRGPIGIFFPRVLRSSGDRVVKVVDLSDAAVFGSALKGRAARRGSLAGGAIDIGMYNFGLALFGFASLYVFWLIKRHFDAAEASR